MSGGDNDTMEQYSIAALNRRFVPALKRYGGEVDEYNRKYTRLVLKKQKRDEDFQDLKEPFGRLPFEIIIEIFTYFRWRDLKNFSFVCSKWANYFKQYLSSLTDIDFSEIISHKRYSNKTESPLNSLLYLTKVFFSLAVRTKNIRRVRIPRCFVGLWKVCMTSTRPRLYNEEVMMQTMESFNEFMHSNKNICEVFLSSHWSEFDHATCIQFGVAICQKYPEIILVEESREPFENFWSRSNDWLHASTIKPEEALVLVELLKKTESLRTIGRLPIDTHDIHEVAVKGLWKNLREAYLDIQSPLINAFTLVNFVNNCSNLIKLHLLFSNTIITDYETVNMENITHAEGCKTLKLLSLENFRGESPKFNLPNLEILHFLPCEDSSFFTSLIKMVSHSPNIKQLELQGSLTCETDIEFKQFSSSFANLQSLQIILNSWQLTRYPAIEGYVTSLSSLESLHCTVPAAPFHWTSYPKSSYSEPFSQPSLMVERGFVDRLLPYIVAGRFNNIQTLIAHLAEANAVRDIMTYCNKLKRLEIYGSNALDNRMFETTREGYYTLELLVVYDLSISLNASLFKNFHKKFPNLKRFTFVTNGDSGFENIFDEISSNVFHIEWLIIGSISVNFRETPEFAKLISNCRKLKKLGFCSPTGGFDFLELVRSFSKTINPKLMIYNHSVGFTVP